MTFEILTLFPDFFISPLEQSIIGRAIKNGLIKVNTHNIREFATDKHSTTDDSPYGGGAGMVMKPEPLVSAIEAIRKAPGVNIEEPLPESSTGGDTGGAGAKVILLTPQGVPFKQRIAEELATEERVILVCGRYEGVDERVRSFVDMELSVGDYVLTGGETAALAVIDAVGRLTPGVIEESSAREDSFSESVGGLEYPQYTRPEDFRGMRVPEVLLGGNHGEIEEWRRLKSLERTEERRPDLLPDRLKEENG